MAKKEATIIYKSSGEDQEIRFHATISEGHKANTVITGYPAQNGFEVSNHAIRKNRKINLELIFTNTLLEGTDQVRYSRTNNSKKMFEVLNNLVQSSQPSKVITNLGVYDPVVFTSFSTTQKAGLMDSIVVSLKGEEVQTSSNISRTTPTKLTFQEVQGSSKERVIAKLEKAGLPHNFRISVLQAKVLLGTDFSIDTRDYSGKPQLVTYECVGYDQTSKAYSYRVHTTNSDIYLAKNLQLSGFSDTTIGNSTSGGLLGISNCLLDKTAGLASELLQKEIDERILTPLGKLRKTIHGFLQETLIIDGGSIGQTLMGFALDCVSIELADELGVPGVNGTQDAIEVFDRGLDARVKSSVDSLKQKGDELIKEVRTAIPEFGTTQAIITIQKNPIIAPLESIREYFS